MLPYHYCSPSVDLGLADTKDTTVIAKNVCQLGD